MSDENPVSTLWKAISDRLSHPVMGVFFLILAAMNWEAICFLFISELPADQRIAKAKSYADAFTIVSLPLFFTLLYVGLSPILRGAATLWEGKVEQQVEGQIRQRITDETDLKLELAERRVLSLQNLQKSLKDSIHELEQTKADSQKSLDDLQRRLDSVKNNPLDLIKGFAHSIDGSNLDQNTKQRFSAIFEDAINHAFGYNKNDMRALRMKGSGEFDKSGKPRDK